MIDVCNQEAKPLLSLEAALSQIKNAIQTISGTETIALQNALGRVLAAPLYAPINSPHERNAAMDGYAFASQDCTETAFSLRLIGSSWAGKPFQGDVQTGECIRIFTGAVLPQSADSVVMQEQVQTQGDTVLFPAQTKARQHVRQIGEDIAQGSVVLAPPKKITALDLGFIASAGIAQCTVTRRIKIGFFSTGDELVELGQPLQSGQIYDSNRYTLNGLLNDPAYTVVDLGIVADDPELLEARFRQAAQDHDVLITTGGASVGDADYVKDILGRCGTVSFWKIAIKPGKPLAFGNIGACHFFGLPGNPVAVAVTFQQLVAPALRQLSGAPDQPPLRITATCTSPLKKAPGREEFQRGILSQTANGEFTVSSSGLQGSNILSAMSRANCYIVLPAHSSGVQAGDLVRVELL